MLLVKTGFRTLAKITVWQRDGVDFLSTKYLNENDNRAALQGLAMAKLSGFENISRKQLRRLYERKAIYY
jgi:hypothetical protein